MSTGAHGGRTLGAPLPRCGAMIISAVPTHPRRPQRRSSCGNDDLRFATYIHMQAFAELFAALDETTRTNEKVTALARYFAAAPPADAAWALYFLSGRRPRQVVGSRQMAEWAAEATNTPLWLFGECYDAVGDLAETVALILDDRRPTNHAEEAAIDKRPTTKAEAEPSMVEVHLQGTDEPSSFVFRPSSLAYWIEQRLLPLQKADEATQKAAMLAAWAELDRPQRFLWNKLITGGFRVGVSQRLVTKALAEVSGIDDATVAHRLMGNWEPTAAFYAELIHPETSDSDRSRPYPFCLAYPLEQEPESLGPFAEWQAEWKWDGIRSQLIKRGGGVFLWSRGEELISERFPELAAAGELLPDGTVIDGEVLPYLDGNVLPFALLQKRIGRKTLTKKILSEVPAVIFAYDLLEFNGEDLRERPLSERRELLEQLLIADDRRPTTDDPSTALNESSVVGRRLSVVMLSPIVNAEDWSALANERERARELAAEGLMLKRRSSPYRVGRVKGDWWKWKVTPYTIDAVLINAQRGSGKRASLYSDYTFAVWDGDTLVPFAKAYSGLTDAEIREVDAFVRRNTLESFGPVRTVKPELVFELAFEGLQRSTRHKSGIAVRFPRMLRWRKDKPASEADSLETVRALL
jgi:DNA ligase 1